jgi:hypothetical protein
MNRDRFSRLEERIQHLVEGSFARLFNNRLHPRDVAVRLAHAMEDHLRPLPDGTISAPTVYVVCLNPADLTALQTDSPELGTRLAEVVVDFAHRSQFRLLQPPTVDLCANDQLNIREVAITAHHLDDARSTQALPMAAVQAAISTVISHRSPQLMLAGREPFPLNRNVTNLGRKRDNHLVIDDPRVSRNHAQIRQRFGRYVVYDLGSTGGTFVNNHRVTEALLQHGDVISLGGVTLVYMEDESGYRPPHDDTQMRERLQSDEEQP